MISYKVPEEQWTEKMIKNLPSEDDRFEFKEDIKVETIAQEICAFANSFGGTLFLGIEDKNGPIKGVEKMKGNKPMTLWLEQKIPVLLEFRFGSFRVREVKLTSSTQKKIGSDKTVISVDVFDSDMTPYQVIQTRKYYRRESSTSKEAPHSYLAYLWSRNSSEKTNVVQHWITDFLTPLIYFTQDVLEQFQDLKFRAEIKSPGSESFNIYQLNHSKSLHKILDKLSANQFLRAYGKLSNEITTLFQAFSMFENFIEDFINSVLEDELIRMNILGLYVTYLANQHPPLFYDNSKSRLQMLSTLTEVRGIKSLADNQDALIYYMSRYITYTFFNFQGRSAWRDNDVRILCKALLKNIRDSEFLIKKKKEMKRLKSGIISSAKLIFDEADSLREELCLRHNTTY